jgi:hypothetical protein
MVAVLGAPVQGLANGKLWAMSWKMRVDVTAPRREPAQVADVPAERWAQTCRRVSPAAVPLVSATRSTTATAHATTAQAERVMRFPESWRTTSFLSDAMYESDGQTSGRYPNLVLHRYSLLLVWLRFK